MINYPKIIEDEQNIYLQILDNQIQILIQIIYLSI